MNPSLLTTSTFDSRIQDARERAEESRRAGATPQRGRRTRRAPADPAAYAEHVLMRSAGPRDRDVIERLAELEGAHPLHGDVLVAEVRGEVVAAVGLEDPRTTADPFTATADVLALLGLRAQQLRAPAAGHGGPTTHVRDRLRALVRRPAPATAATAPGRHGSAPWMPGIGR